MKFFRPQKTEVKDPRGGFVMYPEFCIDTNPKYEHLLTGQEVMVLEQSARIEALEKALGEAVEEIKFQFAEKQKLSSEYFYSPLWDDVAKHNKVIVKIRALLARTAEGETNGRA